MSSKERTRLNEDLLEVNEARKEKSECVLDLSKKLEDRFPEDFKLVTILEIAKTRVESDDSSVDPDIDEDIDDELF